MAELQVQVLTPAKVVVKTAVQLVELPGALGYMGILPGHTRMISELAAGTMTLGTGQEQQIYFISGGYVDVNQDHVTVLADVVERPMDIDVKRAEDAKARALSRFVDSSGVDIARAQAALLRAERRLALAATRLGA